MTQLWNIVATINSWCAALGAFAFGAALVGLIVQREIPDEWMTRLSRIATAVGFGFAGFAIARHYGGSDGFMVLNLADAYLAVLVILGVGLLRGLRDDPDADYVDEYPEQDDETTNGVVQVTDLGAYVNGNHQAPAQRVVIDQPAD